jgi:nucleoside-diphosphate-sugar epimerase
VILVTGGAGRLGYEVVKLLRQGDQESTRSFEIWQFGGLRFLDFDLWSDGR